MSRTLRPSLLRRHRAGEITNWTIVGLIGGGCSGLLAVHIGLIFAFDLGWYQIYPNVKDRLPEGLAVAVMRAGLGVVFGLIAAGMLGTAHALVRGRIGVRAAVGWILVGCSAGVLCWVTLEVIDRYVSLMAHTEYAVWVAIWALIGAVIGCDIGFGRRHARPATPATSFPAR